MIKIRPCTKEDAEAIRQLNRDSLGYDYPLEKTASRLSSILNTPGHTVLVACRDECVVGYIHIVNYDCLYSDRVKDVFVLAVSSACRREGIGRALIAAAEECAKRDGAAGIRLVSSYARKEAHLFYEACGYVSNKDQKNFYKLF